MNREILFRGKTTPKGTILHAFNNVWVQGDLVTTIKGNAYIHPKANSFQVDGELGKIIVLHEVIPETVGQFTGRIDKCGKAIFVGDICRSAVNDCGLIGKIILKDGAFVIEYKNPICDDWTGDLLFVIDTETELEVIGNIHDNPKLLEEQT